MAEQPPWVIAEPRHGVVGVIVWAVFLGAAAAGLAASVSLRRRGVPGRRAYWFIGFLVMAVQWELIADLSGWGVPAVVLLVVGHAVGIGSGIWTAWDIRRRYFPRNYQSRMDVSGADAG